MSDERRTWLGMTRDVGAAFGDLVRAELTAITDDLGRSGTALVRALIVAAIAAAFAFWTLGLAVYFVVELLVAVLPRWGAVGIVLAVFLIATAVLLLVVRARLAAIEPPAATVRRRLDDSRRWWTTRVAPPESSPDDAGGSGEER